VGLTTATLLQEERPDVQVTVIASHFLEDTTSDGAAGIFRPSASNFTGGDPALTRQWIEASYAHYTALLKRPDAAEIGVKTLDAVLLSTEHEHVVRNSLLEELLPQYRRLGAPELRSYAGGPYRHGAQFSTLLVENRRYLPYLMRLLVSRGGCVEQRSLASLEELAGRYDAAINCSGLAARALCGDTSLTPIRGQVLKVKAPWIKQCYYSDFDTYIIPGFDYVTLGGCRQFDSWSTAVDPHDTAAILERCVKLMPSLKGVKVERAWAGLRPYRPTVRVEAELMRWAGEGEEEKVEGERKPKQLRVVHCYGHGGYGVTAAPGTAATAVGLLLAALPPPHAKL